MTIQTQNKRTRKPNKPSSMSTKVDESMAARGLIRAIRASKRLGVVPSTIYNWARDGLVVTEKAGSATYVNIETLLAQLGPERVRVLGVTRDPKTWS